MAAKHSGFYKSEPVRSRGVIAHSHHGRFFLSLAKAEATAHATVTMYRYTGL
jgi:hypothetical protein